MIRRARPGDGEELARVFRAAIAESAGSHYSEEQRWAWSSGLTAATFETRIGLLEIRVAETTEGMIVGFAALDTHTTELDYLYIHPSASRTGIATILFNSLVDFAREHGMRSLYVIASLNALAFYEKVGFREKEHLIRTRQNIQLPCVRMELSIADES